MNNSSGYPNETQSIVYSKQERHAECERQPESMPSTEKRVTFGRRRSSYSDREDHEYDGSSYFSDESDPPSHNSEYSYREKEWSRDEKRGNRTDMSIASSVRESVRRSIRSDTSSSDMSYGSSQFHDEGEGSWKNSNDTVVGKSGQPNYNISNKVSKVAPKNSVLYYIMLFTLSMTVTASVTLGGVFAHRIFVNSSEGKELFPSTGYPSQAPSPTQSIETADSVEHPSQLPAGTWSVEPHTHVQLSLTPSMTPITITLPSSSSQTPYMTPSTTTSPSSSSLTPSMTPSTIMSCSNDNDFKFTTGNGIAETCGWLLNNSLRKDKYCPVPSIKQNCCFSCTYSPDSQCIDDDEYVFTSDNGNAQDW